jgi:predicted phage baseplate assembly protein
MPMPTPNLDDRTFDQLVDEARRRIPVYAPEWTDHNVHDPGITFIELFAWLTEIQLYNLNRIRDRNYLKFLKLLGIKPRPASPAQVEVTFTSNDIIVIEKGTKVVAKDIQTGEKVTFETDEDIEVLPATLKRVVSFANYKFTEVTEFNAPNQSFYYPFGEKAEIGSRVYLGFDFEKDTIVGKQINLKMNLYEEGLPPKGQHDDESLKVYPSVEVSWEYWNGGEWSALELNLPVDELVETLSQNGNLSFIVPADIARSKVPSVDEELYWVRCRVIQDGYEIPPRIDRILLNTVSATQGKKVQEETLGESSGLPYQTFTTNHSPVLVGSEVITIKGESWQAVDDFDASDPESKHYVISGDKGEISFADGVQGKIPPEGEEIKITYRYGGGEVGNVPAKSITKAHGKNGESIKIEVTNHFPATGGREKETIREAILGARRILKTQSRAVTSDDFEFIAKATPGLRVARAKAIVPTKNSVTLVVVPHSPLEKATPSSGFIRTVCEHMDMHRLITTFIKIEKPDYVRVSVNTTLKIEPGYKPEAVKGRVEEALNKFLSPLTGGSDNQGWPFGRSVYRSEVYEVLEGVEGVDCVLKLFIAGADKDFDIGDLSLVYPGTHTVEIIEPETVCKEKQCNE